jgi:hypothetical protein
MVTAIVLLAMIGLLKEASYAVFVIGVILFLYIPYKYREKNIEFFSSTPTVLLIIFSLVFFFISRDSHFFFWDEFSHWGLFIKEMMYTDRLYDASTIAAHPHYVPGAPTWQYFTMLFSGFSEGGAYFAQFLLISSATMMIYEKTSFKKPHWIVLAFLLQIAFLANFGHGLNKIYVDHVVGAMFAGLIMVILYDRFDKKSIFLLLAPLTAIAFIKEVGLYFSAASVGLLLLRYIFIEKNKKLIYISILLGILTLVVFKAWDIRLGAEGVNKGGQSISGIVSSIISNEKMLDEQTHTQVKDRFWEIFFDQQIAKDEISENFNEFDYFTMGEYKDSFRLTTFWFLVTFIIVSLITTLAGRQEGYKKSDVLLPSAYMLFIILGYFTILCISYFVAFGGNAFRIPSYVRYTNIAIMPAMFFLASYYLPLARKVDIKEDSPIAKVEIKPLLIVSLATLMLYTLETPNLKTIYKANELNSFRAQTIPTINAIKSKIPESSDIYAIIPVPNNGSFRNFLRYDMYPSRLTADEIAIFQQPINKIYEKMGEHEYVWLPFQSQKVQAIYQRLLQNQNVFNLYKVEKQGEDLALKPLM